MHPFLKVLLIAVSSIVLQGVVIFLFSFAQFWNYEISPLYISLSYLFSSLSLIIIILFYSRIFKLYIFEYIHGISFPFFFNLFLINIYLQILFPIFGFPIEFINKISLDQINVFFPGIKSSISFSFVISCVGSIIITPILEEFVFRGLIFNLLKRNYSVLFSILFSSLIFAFSHLELEKVWHAFFMGIIYGWFFHKTNNLLVPIILHAGYNFLAVFTQRIMIHGDSFYFLPYLILVLLSIGLLYKAVIRINQHFPIQNMPTNDLRKTLDE